MKQSKAKAPANRPDGAGEHCSAPILSAWPAEERYLWACARNWRTPANLDPVQGLDWERVVQIAQANRMQTLLYQVLLSTGHIQALSPATCETLQQDVIRLRQDAALLSQSLQTYLHHAAQRGIETVVLKGLSVSINIYGQPAMRPGGDIDILVRKKDVAASLAILDEMGIGQHWPNLLHDRYYERHHLHQQRCTRDLKIWFEIHWALDHPYTLLTIDYEGVMARTTAGQLLGQPVRDLALPDLLLSLAIHLVKHAIYLPSVVERPDLARIILADGMLMYFLDIAEVIRQKGAEIDWPLTVRLAREWGAVDILGSVLRVCQRYLGADVPASVLAQLPVRGPGGVTRRAMSRIADYELSTFLGQPASRLWDFLLVTNGAFILRPIRLLDLGAYIFPPREFLFRRYGSDSWWVAAGHALRATAQYGRNGLDTLYYTWERYRRLKALNQSASLFNRLEVE